MSRRRFLCHWVPIDAGDKDGFETPATGRERQATRGKSHDTGALELGETPQHGTEMKRHRLLCDWVPIGAGNRGRFSAGGSRSG